MNMKKFLSAFMAGSFFVLFFFLPVTVTAQSQTPPKNLGEEYSLADNLGKTVEDFYKSLPLKKDYKSSKRPLLISGAMNSETEILARALKNPSVYRCLNYLYIAGTYKDYPVVISRTEQGLTNSAASTALAIKIFNPVAVINQGTSGGHLPTLKVNDIIIGAVALNLSAFRTAYIPEGAGIDITDRVMIGTYAYDKNSGKFEPNERYFADTTLVKIAEEIAVSHKEFKTVTGIIGTYDSWLSDVDHINFLNGKYGEICEEMETVSVAQICKNVDLPWIGIRVISNNITNGGEYDPSTGDTAQKFSLLVAEKYINDVLKK